MKNKTRTLPFLVLSVVTVLLIYLCAYCPWIGDEIRYMFSFATGDRIKDFKDIIISQNEHYFSVNGRYIAHVLVQIFCGLSNHIVFAICNGLVFIVFALMTLRLAGIKLNNVILSILGILLCFLGFQTRAVPSCQIGYMWMFTLVMIVLWFYLYNPNIDKRWWWILIPFCIVAGCGQEAINLGVCVAMLIYAWQHRKSMTATQWVVLLAFGFGTLILVASPGSHQRVGVVHGLPKSSQMVHNVVLFVEYVCITFVLAFVLMVGKIRKRISLLQCYKDYAFYWHILAICFAINVFISIFCNRQLFGMELAALIITLNVLRRMEYRKLNGALVFMVSVWFAWVSYHNIKTVNAFSKDYTEIVTSYCSSEDGVVFLDSREQSQPFPCKNICEELHSEWGLSNVNRLLKSDPNNNDKTLVILPTAFYPLSASRAYTVDSNNNLFVKCNAKNTSSFSVVRHKELFGYKLPHQDMNVNINDEEPVYRLGDIMVYITASASWIKTDTVTFQP